MKVANVLVVFHCLLCRQSSVGYYLQHGEIGGKRISEMWPELKESVTVSGELYKASIASSNLSDFDIQFLVSKVGLPNLPKWLTYQETGFNLEGLPLFSDTGVHQLFIVAMKYNKTANTAEFMGAQTFKINVLSRENRTYCEQGNLIVFANFLLIVNATHLNSAERLKLYQDFKRTYNLSQTSDIFFEEKPKIWKISRTTGSCNVTFENKVSSWNHTDPILGISLIIGCSLNNTWEHAINTIINISSKLGSTLADFPLLGWKILNGIDGGKCSSYFGNTHSSSILSSVYPSTVNSWFIHGPSSLSPPFHVSTSIASSTFATELSSSTASTSLLNETSSSSFLRLTEVPYISTSIASSTFTTKLLFSTTNTSLINELSSLSSLRLTTISNISTSIASSTFAAQLLSSTASAQLINETSSSSSLSRTAVPYMSIAPSRFPTKLLFLINKTSSSLNLTTIPYISTSDIPSTFTTELLSSTTSTSLINETSSSSSIRLTEVPYLSSSILSSMFLTELSTLSSTSSAMQDGWQTKWSSSIVSPTQTWITMTTTATPQNRNPTVHRALPKLNITTCEYVFLEVPHDTFLDEEDGGTRNLTLRLLTNDFLKLPSDSWISFDPNRNVIYGVPSTTQVLKNSKRGVFEYVLSAVDRGGRSANTTLTIVLTDEQHTIGQRISVEVDTYVKPIYLSPLELIKVVSGYLYNGDKASMEILNLTLTNGNPPKVHITWSDCKAIRDFCDVTRVERIARLIRVSGIMNPQFMIALMPRFVLHDVQERRLGACLNKPPLATRHELLINITCCEKFQFQVPHDLFTDNEDGHTRNLSLTLRHPNGSRLDSDSWIALNTSKTIRGVMSFAHAQNLPTSVAGEFIIVAVDSGRLETNVSVRVIIQHPLPSSNYHVTLILKRTESGYLSWLQEACLIMEKLMSYIGDQTSNNIRVLSLRQQNLVTIFSWTNGSLPLKPCDTVAIANILAKLKLENGGVRSDFKAVMQPQYEVQFVFEEKLGHCKNGANERPKTLRALLSLRLNKTFTFFEMEIPADTFHDLEDGNTRQLKLSLLSTSFDPVPKDSWIVLNPQTQLIYGLPDERTNRVQPADGFRYLLVAQDSGGKVASSTLRVEIPSDVQPYNYVITARARSYLDVSLPCVNHVVKFIEKITAFTSEEQDSVRVMSYNISKTYPADVTISWTNRTASLDTCDHDAIKRRFREFSTTSGRATTAFSDVLLPYFIIQKINLKLYGICTQIPNNPPVVLSPVPLLNISIYHILNFFLPEKMFFDKEDGYTRNLTVKVLDKNGETFSSWFAFNTTSQLLYGVATRTVARQQQVDGFVFTIVAMDTDGGAANTTMVIKIESSIRSSLNYEMKVKAMVNRSRQSSDVDEVLEFFSKLKMYSKDSQELLLVDYVKQNSTLEVTFSSPTFVGDADCDFAELETLRQHFFLKPNSQRSANVTKSQGDDKNNNLSSSSHPNSEPSYNFTKEMAPHFLVTEIREFEKGPCSNTPPVVFKPLPSFVISSYSLFSIRLPPETFYDAEDGFTSNLSVFLLSSTGESLPPDSWIQFNETSNQLYGIITDQVILENPPRNYSFLFLAQDVYGLKANASFDIHVPGSLLDIGLKLNMILRSHFSSVVPHVDILERWLTSMVVYFGDNNSSFVNVNSFQRGSGVPSTDILTWSNTTLDSTNCNLETLSDISRRTRQSDNQPIPSFKKALQPEFEIMLVFEQRLGSCENRQNSPPRVLVPFLSLNISKIPSVLRYTIPRNIFHDSEDGDTRNLTLSILGSNHQAISLNSSVQLNVPSQVIYGIFTAEDLISENQVKRFILVATDSGGKTASAVLRIFLENQTIPYTYKVNVKFTSYLSSLLPDVSHLINFQEKLQTFPVLRDTQLASYARASGYPARFVASFVNASSARVQSCDYDGIARISEVFRDTGTNPRKAFVTRFLPEFVLDAISVQRFGPCEFLRNEVPKVNVRIPVINISICEILQYKIPSETFSDEEEGDTRNLTLGLHNLSPNSSWITMDVPSQTLHAIPTVDAARHQPPGGYEFTLTAADSHDALGDTIVTIFVIDDVMVDNYRLTASVRIPVIFQNSQLVLLKAIAFAEAIQRYLSGSVSRDMRVIRFDKMTSSQLTVTWSNCSHGYTPCDYEKIEHVREVAVFEKGLPWPEFIQSLAPEFMLDSVVEEMRGPCLNKGPVTKREVSPLIAKLCGRLEHKIPAETFYDDEDGYTSNLSLVLVRSNGEPLGQDFWLAFNSSSQTILGYPNVDAASSQPGSGYEFLLNAKDRHGLSTNTGIRVIYKGTVLQSTYEVTLVLRAQFTTLPSSIEHLRIIIQKLAEYVSSGQDSIRVHSFVRARPNSTVSFLTWSNCSFPSNSCDVRSVSETSKRLRDLNGGILEKFKEAFLPEFTLLFVFEQRLGACLRDSNFPPKVTQNLKPFVLENDCGIWEYFIPSSLFHDEEEGYTRNLTLSIKTSDFRDVSASAWIQLDEPRQQLYGFPQLRNPRNSSSEVLVLLAADSKGKLGTASLETIFQTEIPNSHYEITVEMLSFVEQSFPDIYQVRKFIERLAVFLDVDKGGLRVMGYERITLLSGGSRLTVTWTNCSYSKNSCDHQQIQLLFSRLNSAKSEIPTTFSEAMLPYFVPTRVTLVKTGPCIVPPSPGILRPIGNISSFSGTLLSYRIPENMFVDDEDGTTSNLSLMLQFVNKTVVPSSYWLKLDDVDDHAIYGVLTVERSWNATFRLVARDRHGNEGVDVFEVFVEQKCSEEQLDYKVTMEVDFLGKVAEAKIRILRRLQSYFQDWITAVGDVTLVSMNKMAENNSSFTIIWSHFAACERCDQVNSTIQSLSQRLVHRNGTPRVEFTDALASEFTLVNVSETRCSAGTGAGVGVTIVKGGKDDRWLLYIVPIATIAIFFLFCFLFFIFRAFVSNYKGRRDEIIFDEQPSLASTPRDIHVVDGISSREEPLSIRERVSFVEGELLENAYVNVAAPEILLDKRISPSKSSLRQDLSPISTNDVTPRVVYAPPLYTEAVFLQLAPTGPGKRSPSPTTRIEMTELPVVRKSENPILSSEFRESDERRNSRVRRGYSSPYPSQQERDKNKERLQEDEDDGFDEQEYEMPIGENLRLPTPPNVGMLRLPPVPKPLGNSPASSLVNTPERESQSSSPFQTPLFANTSVHSLSIMQNTHNAGQRSTPDVPVGFPRTSPHEPPRILEYPYETSLQPISPAYNPLADRTILGVQSPRFPPPYEMVPYIDHRGGGQGPVGPNAGANPRSNVATNPAGTSPNDLHQVLGELRESVNRELDRRNDVDKYLDYYMNTR